MFILDVIMPVQLLQVLVQEFQGESNILLLAGNPATLDAHLLSNVEVRGPDYSRLATIPLTEDNVQVLVKRILPRLGVRTNFHEIEIRSKGEPEEPFFNAFDNFCPWVAETGPYNKGAALFAPIRVELLDRLVEEGVLRKYWRPDTEPGT